MSRKLGHGLFALLIGCASRSPSEHLAREAAFFRMGVDRRVEEREVRRTLAQRHLDVVSDVRAPEFVALGAESRDGRLTAVRVITGRGVVLAEDALCDDLFAPGRVVLNEQFAPSAGELTLVGFTRLARFADAGCVTLKRVQLDGTLSEVMLDVSRLGGRACVSSLVRGERGRLVGQVGFPSWSHGQTPLLKLELAFQNIPLGKADPPVRVARPIDNSSLLEVERQRLLALSCEGVEFATRHAIGVARAALLHFTGQSTDRAVAAYRECVGIPSAGSREALAVSEALSHIERGFSDAAPEAQPGAPGDAAADEAGGLVIEPSGSGVP